MASFPGVRATSTPRPHNGALVAGDHGDAWSRDDLLGDGGGTVGSAWLDRSTDLGLPSFGQRLHERATPVGPYASPLPVTARSLPMGRVPGSPERDPGRPRFARAVSESDSEEEDEEEEEEEEEEEDYLSPLKRHARSGAERYSRPRADAGDETVTDGVEWRESAGVATLASVGGEERVAGARAAPERPEPDADRKGGPTRAPVCRHALGHEVLARWSDGLFYLGTIKKVDRKKGSCYITFEDRSEFWVLWKDIQALGSPPSGEMVCTICQEGSSDSPNEIVICDKCGQGYHQRCHIPNIDSELIACEASWQCRQCIFVTTTKRGGALKKGPQARALQTVKLTRPYSLEELEWDAQHRTNMQQVYCYCGGPGEWYLKMLQCCSCRQWFHEACTQCLERPMHFGDRFYLFVCSVCNAGPEYIKRLPLRWVDITQLCMYNLTVVHKKKYFDFEKEVMPFVHDNWDSLQLGEMADTTRQKRYQCVMHALISNKSKFVCGREIKKKQHLYGLRMRVPPTPPSISLPAALGFAEGDGPLSLANISYPSPPRPTRRRRLSGHPRRPAARAGSSSLTGPAALAAFPRTAFGLDSVNRAPSRLKRGLGGTAPLRRSPRVPGGGYRGDEGPGVPGGGLAGDGDAVGPGLGGLQACLSRLAPSPGPACLAGGGAEGRAACGEAFRVLGRRVGPDGRVQYLVEWAGTTPG
ncbi:metal-response element-binding transcription factor 2-like isoform X2 [Lethenteron reissneri]|uniref:metal-response element-binding transcription factor 2-like isoform X2 n=1 Tax=Lethenteron reissneri TaxID=7753 RepID=UPI002AB7E62D|nr:metal-response element-binding transcription factor 2-like isoform X2 [Lethenteron reissneri]